MGVRSMRLLWISVIESGEQGGIIVGESVRWVGDWEDILMEVVVGGGVADDGGLSEFVGGNVDVEAGGGVT